MATSRSPVQEVLDMSMLRRRPALIAAALLLPVAVVGAGVVAAGAASAASAPYCGITWGSLAKDAGNLSPAALVATRTGRHACFDRLVFEFAGSGGGYRVAYADEVSTEGQGLPLSGETAGGALIKVVLTEPAYNPGTGGVVYPFEARDHVAGLDGYRTLRDVVYGGSFEGYTTFAVGVRARLPFRVFTVAGPGSHSRIVLDVAHRW
jgi:hypothetical protein